MRALIALCIGSVFLTSCNDSDKKAEDSKVSLSEAKKEVSTTTKLDESIVRGKVIYTDFCMSCHMPNGKGVPQAFPPLAKSDYLMNNRLESIKSIKYGLSGEITVNDKTYNGVMTPLGLEDEEIADVMNYITNSWGNSNDSLITVQEVSEIEE
ncbi:c-type cytochrome [Psychroserpens sp. MEBiC05023]